MLESKKISIGESFVLAISLKLLEKNLLVIRGNKGYIMCGYLDLNTADKFAEVAVKIKGPNTIEEALEAKVDSCSKGAEELGIYKNQDVKDVLKIIV